MLLISEQNGRKKEDLNGKLVSQTRLTIAVRYLSPLRKIIAMGYGKHNKRSAFNMAVADAMRYAIEGMYPDLTVNPQKVRLTRGGLLHPLNPAAVRIGDKLTVTFDPGFDKLYGFGDDEVILCAYNPDVGVAGINEERCRRQDGALELQLPVQLADAAVTVYLFARDRSGKRFSNSVFLGVL